MKLRYLKPSVLIGALVVCLGVTIGPSATPADAVPVPGGRVELVSVGSAGFGGNDRSSAAGATLSSDGRYVAFKSEASDLVAGDTNGQADIFVRDRQAGTTERVSVATGGAQADGRSEDPSISADGRYVSFVSLASNLGASGGLTQQVYVHDRQRNVTTWVSVLPVNPHFLDITGGTRPVISADGTHVVYVTNGVANGFGAGPGSFLVMIRNLAQANPTLVSLASDGDIPIDSGLVTLASVNDFPDLSEDGRYVVWTSNADNLVPSDVNDNRDVFLRDRLAGTTTLVSVNSDGTQGDTSSDRPHISGDGSRVTFWSNSRRLVDNDFNTSRDVFLRMVATGTTELISITPEGVAGSGQDHDISRDGSTVVFWSRGQDFVDDETIGSDLYIRDIDGGRTYLASFAFDGSQPSRHVHVGGSVPGISDDGSTVVYSSRSSEVISGVTSDEFDVFVADQPPAALRGLTCNGMAATIVGTAGDDVLGGTSADDVIVGLEGDDRISGRGGNDVICGNGGDDDLRGNSGADVLLGGSGADNLRGGRSADLLIGNSGRDRLNGGSGGDTLRGGSGRDVLLGKKGNDRLNGGSGNDRLRGGSGRDTLRGKRGRDDLHGGKGSDKCVGGKGRDTVRACER